MLKISKFRWDQVPESVPALRQRVFVDEQGVPPELEWDATDDLADHFLATDAQGRALGVARLYPDGTGNGAIGRMAVAGSTRGRGVGTALLRAAMEEGASQYSHLTVSAQRQAEGFYRRLGFVPCSEEYEDAGMPHRTLRCTAPDLALRQPAEARLAMTLGEDTTSWQLTGDHDWNGCLDGLVSQARRFLWIYEQTLDPARYDRHFLREACSALARRNRHTEIRFLIHADRPLVERQHRLVTLIRRLPSHIQLRVINPELPSEDGAFALADEGLVYRHQRDAAEGFANFNAPRRVKPLSESFLRMWEGASPSPELRNLAAL